MATTPDRSNLAIKLIVAVLGILLAVVGWYRYFGG